MWRFLLLGLIANNALACACAGPGQSAKQAWEQAPVVFYGTVISALPEIGSMFEPQSVEIRADEAFKGSKPGDTFALHLGASDCDAKFRNGQRVLLHLFGNKSKGWGIAACSGPPGDAIEFLRGLPDSAKSTRVAGHVEIMQPGEETFRALGGVEVKITGPTGAVYREVTNADGIYARYGLKAGRYSISLDPPVGTKIYFPMLAGAMPVKGKETTFDLSEDGDVSVGFVLQPDTKLTGRMLSADGKPLDRVCIDVDPVLGSFNGNRSNSRFFDCSKNRGAFSISNMPPGKYRLVLHDTIKIDGHESASTLYYPGVRDRDHAGVVTIEPNNYVDGLDIRMPHDETRYLITGRVEFADRVPAPGDVVFASTGGGYTETTRAGADGTFAFMVIAGMKGELRGDLAMFPYPRYEQSCPQFKTVNKGGMFGHVNAIPMPISIDSDHENIKLVVPAASCADWRPLGR